ncbi:hypothetical protein DFH27DRAFT_609679 [Peziza echinospora]|nr:hypothetical protein DFH27DRAFT_609679 [Peziza echinospora]
MTAFQLNAEAHEFVLKVQISSWSCPRQVSPSKSFSPVCHPERPMTPRQHPVLLTLDDFEAAWDLPEDTIMAMEVHASNQAGGRLYTDGGVIGLGKQEVVNTVEMQNEELNAKPKPVMQHPKNPKTRLRSVTSQIFPYSAENARYVRFQVQPRCPGIPPQASDPSVTPTGQSQKILDKKANGWFFNWNPGAPIFKPVIRVVLPPEKVYKNPYQPSDYDLHETSAEGYFGHPEQRLRLSGWEELNLPEELQHTPSAEHDNGEEIKDGLQSTATGPTEAEGDSKQFEDGSQSKTKEARLRRLRTASQLKSRKYIAPEPDGRNYVLEQPPMQELNKSDSFETREESEDVTGGEGNIQTEYGLNENVKALD